MLYLIKKNPFIYFFIIFLLLGHSCSYKYHNTRSTASYIKDFPASPSFKKSSIDYHLNKLKEEKFIYRFFPNKKNRDVISLYRPTHNFNSYFNSHYFTKKIKKLSDQELLITIPAKNLYFLSNDIDYIEFEELLFFSYRIIMTIKNIQQYVLKNYHKNKKVNFITPQVIKVYLKHNKHLEKDFKQLKTADLILFQNHSNCSLQLKFDNKNYLSKAHTHILFFNSNAIDDIIIKNNNKKCHDIVQIFSLTTFNFNLI